MISEENTSRTASRRFAWMLFALAVLLYLPGIWWGLPHATAPDRTRPWGSDELAPFGPIAELYSIFVAPEPRFNPQYPLFQYLLQGVFCAPYLGWLALSGGLTRPSPDFPHGLAHPVEALAVLTILARALSLLMAAGVVVIAYRTAALLWDLRTARIAGLLVLLLFPMFYYSRTSNVDTGALFWTGLGLMTVAACFRYGLDLRRALMLGVFAALASATKDASAFAFIAAATVLVPWHLAKRGSSGLRSMAPLVSGLAVSVLVYLVASGWVFSRARFQAHLDWMRGTSAALMYPDSLAGYLGLLRETAGHTAASLGLPAALLALAGLSRSVLRDRRALWLVLVAIVVVVATIIPIRFVNFRYVLIVAYCFAFFAAYALSAMYTARSHAIQRLALPLTAFVLLWSAVRGLDLTYQMINDSRYDVAQWLRANARPGDRIAYFGASQKLPALEPGVITVSELQLCSRSAWRDVAPDFVLVIPQQHFELTHDWRPDDYIYQALAAGSLGYARFGTLQTAGLSSRRPVPFVNPPVTVFVRNDRVPQATPLPHADSNGPLLAGLEARLGLGPEMPSGLVPNPNPRSSPPCHGVPW